MAAQKILNAQAGELNDVENLSTKALGVVQESGLFASLLFLLTRTREQDRKSADQIRTTLLNSAQELYAPKQRPTTKPAELAYVTSEICADLQRTLLVRSLWEQTLIYTRYGAKALKKS